MHIALGLELWAVLTTRVCAVYNELRAMEPRDLIMTLETVFRTQYLPPSNTQVKLCGVCDI